MSNSVRSGTEKSSHLFLTLIVLVLSTAFIVDAAYAGSWLSIKGDGNHDRRNKTAMKFLQDPEDALSQLPPDTAGNQVDWVKAIEEGYIQPRSNLYDHTEVRMMDLDIIMPETSTMNYVMFPHQQHTAWLDCKNCHPVFFEAEVGVSPVNMGAILEGEFCGRCHGAVSFPLTECNRCHSIIQGTFTGQFGAQYPEGANPEDYAYAPE